MIKPITLQICQKTKSIDKQKFIFIITLHNTNLVLLNF